MTPLGVSARLLADSDTGKGSPIGLFVVLVLIVAVYFLYRSMSRHIKRIPESFDAAQDAGPSGTAVPPGAPPTGSGSDAVGRRGEPTA